MPTIPSIRTSVENQSVLVLDEHANNGVFRRDARGRLIAYTGGFSVVFPYETANGEKWAFRCWHVYVNNSKRRYDIISDAIQQAQLDFLCGFEYTENGINVDGRIYPTTRMRWIDGITIKDYICQNRDSKQLLKELADKFLAMTRSMHNLSLAHGDLQHGNILVDKNYRLYLVDYDSFYCPELQGEADNVTGLPDYQHPARCSNKSVSEKLDYFSELIIYLSILAIAENPSLVAKYQVEDADRMLFSKDDYGDLIHSSIYQDVKSLGKEFAELLDVLERYLKHNSINELKPFEEYLLENKIVFTTQVKKAIRNKQDVIINWNVPYEANILLLRNGVAIPECDKLKDSYKTKLAEDAKYELVVTTPDNRQITKEIVVKVFDECTIDFSSDKYYVFPTIPVVLSWSVTNAKKVWLDSEEVEITGTKVIEPKEATTYVLSAKDEFGKKDKRIDIKMLPIPQVKSILVPIPNFVSNMSLTIQQPRYKTDVKFPQIDIDWLKMDVPKVPSLTDLGLNVKLSPPMTKFNLMGAINKVFKHVNILRR